MKSIYQLEYSVHILVMDGGGGSYFFFFFSKYSTYFAIIPMYWHHYHCTYEYGNEIKNGTIPSWSDERQREKQEDDSKNKKRGLWL